jgi:hypothetical protein
MAMPSFARLGKLRGDPAYATKLYQLYNHTKRTRQLWIPSSGLWYRDERFRPGGITSPNGKPVVWSPGNGWVARARNGMVTTAVHPDGFLGYVQGVGDRPESSQPITYNTTADFGAFLLAGAELAALSARAGW